MSGSELALSILAAVVTALVGVIVSLVLKSQSKFEQRMERHVHNLREDVHTCAAQILVLKTVIAVQLPVEQRAKIDTIFPELKTKEQKS